MGMPGLLFLISLSVSGRKTDWNHPQPNFAKFKLAKIMPSPAKSFFRIQQHLKIAGDLAVTGFAEEFANCRKL